MLKNVKPFVKSLTVASIVSLGIGTTSLPGFAAESVTVYKSPWCGCCEAWVSHMRGAGFEVQVKEMEDMQPAKKMLGVPEDMESCHTAVIDGYIVEGHVPVADIKRLLQEKPSARGLAVPGMPAGSPGMEQGGMSDPYDVVLFDDDGERRLYASY